LWLMSTQHQDPSGAQAKAHQGEGPTGAHKAYSVMWWEGCTVHAAMARTPRARATAKGNSVGKMSKREGPRGTVRQGQGQLQRANAAYTSSAMTETPTNEGGRAGARVGVHHSAGTTEKGNAVMSGSMGDKATARARKTIQRNSRQRGRHGHRYTHDHIVMWVAGM
jgi:hypothetical protein